MQRRAGGAAAGFWYVPAEELIGEQMVNAVGASPLPATAAHSRTKVSAGLTVG